MRRGTAVNGIFLAQTGFYGIDYLQKRVIINVDIINAPMFRYCFDAIMKKTPTS